MNEKQIQDIPNSPETQPSEVRQQLEQNDVTHQGVRSPVEMQEGEASAHLGATENEVTPVTPPMAGPANLVDDRNAQQDADALGVNPRQELTEG